MVRAMPWSCPATGVLSVTTARGTWIAPPTRVAWTPAAFEHHHTAHGNADMRILFLLDALAARLHAHPAVLTVSGLAREALLALTAEEADTGGRAPEAVDRLHAVVVDEPTAAPEQPLHLPGAGRRPAAGADRHPPRRSCQSADSRRARCARRGE
jgi:hypothetical protein